MSRPGAFKDHVHQAFVEAVENGKDVERLRKLVAWCRPRLKRGRFPTAQRAAAFARYMWPDQEQDETRSGLGWDVELVR